MTGPVAHAIACPHRLGTLTCTRPHGHPHGHVYHSTAGGHIDDHDHENGQG